jgi:general secretion pathway protein D
VATPRGLAAVALALALLSIAPAHADDTLDDEALHRCAKTRGPIAVSFKPDVTLRELVDWAMGFSCANFVISSGVSKRSLSVELITPSKLDRDGAWQLFLTALRSMGLTAVRKGAAYEIVEAPQAKGHALPVYPEGERPAGAERVVRAIVGAEHMAVGELATALGALKSSNGEVTALDSAGVVLVTDFASHLARMREVLAAIDRPSPSSGQVYVIPIVHADVESLATTLEAIVGAAPQPAPARAAKGRAPPTRPEPTAAPTKILGDERTRSIILVASPAAYRRARALIRRLDIDTGAGNDGHIHMIALEHADAEQTAKTLSALLAGQPIAPSGAAPRSQPAPAITGEVRVVHDAATNSLLVRASMRDFLGISAIVDRLDQGRRQVYIEAMILEVSVGQDRDLGGSFHLGGERDGGVWVSGLQQERLRSVQPEGLATATGLLGAVLGQPLAGEFLGQTIPSFGVLFQALATGRRANLLSSPRITTSDNTEAVFRVAETRRELGAIQTVGSTGATQQSIEAVDANLTLKVTPHVNATDQIRLEIELLIEEFIPSTSGLGSDKTAREIRNTVVIRDQESIVLGGLLLDREVDVESKIPLLGDIPVIGHLFKSTQKDIDKQNLVILLTPYILDGGADHSEIVRRNMAERAEFMRSHTSLEAVEYRPAIDYRRKRGLLEAINRSARHVEAEREAIEAIEREAAPPAEGPL